MHCQWKLLILQIVIENGAESNSNIDFVPYEDFLQNQKSLQALADACDRYHISNKVGTAKACVVLIDFDMITPDKTQSVIDKNKLRRERTKVDSIEFDGRQDATLAVDKINEKYFASIKRTLCSSCLQ